jgi:hypothetical protein
MNAYRPEASYHRPLFGAAAVALTAVTFALAVALPAAVEPGQAALLASNPAAHVTEGAFEPVRLGVIEVCAPSDVIRSARSRTGDAT